MSKDRKPYPSETQDRFIIRFPDGMRDHIREAAEKNGRSMNAEIIQRLQDSFSAYQASSSRTDHFANESPNSAISAAFFDQDFKTEIQKTIEKMAKNTFAQTAEDLKKKIDELHEKEMELIKKLSTQSASDILQEKIDQMEAQRSAEKENLKKRP